MDLHYLEIFYEVAKARSFTKAAEKLFINQSAVSIQVKKFEDLLGTKLFDRRTKKIKLTYTGEILYKMAEDIFEKVKRSEKEIMKVIQLNRSKISIGASPIIAEPLIPGVIKKFTREHSEIEYDIQVFNKNQLVKKLKEGELDVIIIDEENIKDPNLEVFEIERVPYVLVGKKNFSNISELMKFPLINRDDIVNNNKAIESLENKYRMTFDSRINIVGNLGIIKSMVKEEMANVILPYYAVYKDVKDGKIKILEKIDEVKDSYQAVITKDKSDNAQVMSFISSLSEYKIME